MKSIHKEKTIYSFDNAISILKKNSKVKFLESIEMAIKLTLIPKKNIIKGYSILPFSIGKNLKIGVFVLDDITLKSNQDVTVINQNNMHNFNKKNLDFDNCITSHEYFLKMKHINKILNHKKLNPDKKYGTLTNNIKYKVKEIKSNYVKFKSDKNGMINCAIGKIDIDNKKLIANAEKIINDIKKNKSRECKKLFIKKIVMSSTMGESLIVDPDSIKV